MQYFQVSQFQGLAVLPLRRRRTLPPVYPFPYQCWYTCGTALWCYNFPTLFSILSGLKYSERWLQVPFSTSPFLSADCLPVVVKSPHCQRFSDLKVLQGIQKPGKSEFQNFSFYFKIVATIFKGSALAI